MLLKGDSKIKAVGGSPFSQSLATASVETAVPEKENDILLHLNDVITDLASLT